MLLNMFFNPMLNQTMKEVFHYLSRVDKEEQNSEVSHSFQDWQALL